MQQLHPKAVWLFFIQNLVGLIGLLFTAFFLYSWFIRRALDSYSEGEVDSVFFSFLQMLPLWLIVLFIIFLVVSYILSTLTYKYWKYQLTDTAVSVEKGIIWKKYISIPYDRIQNVDIYRGVLARLMGLSDLQIQTAGYAGDPKHGSSSEGRLPGLGVEEAKALRDTLLQKVKGSKSGV